MKQFVFTKADTLEAMSQVARYCQTIQPEKRYSLEIKEYREKRSLDANAYMWALIGKMAEVLRTDKDSIYLLMLKRYGQQFVAKIPNDAVEMFKRQYPYVEEHEKLAPEERAQYFRVYLGSSNYNTAEMSVLIDGVVEECKELGIETLTPQELAAMKEAWNG